jgi:hypothetical protein
VRSDSARWNRRSRPRHRRRTRARCRSGGPESGPDRPPRMAAFTRPTAGPPATRKPLRGRRVRHGALRDFTWRTRPVTSPEGGAPR